MKIERLLGAALCGLARVITGARAIHHAAQAPAPTGEPSVYYANHRSHIDFLLVWAALPPRVRRRTRPVAGADYWNKSALRHFIGGRVFRAVLIDRERKTSPNGAGSPDPIEQMVAALAGGDSLILFPEGTRNTTDAVLLPFKSGLFHLAQTRPNVALVPAWIDNLNRVMPKGEFVPIPLICTVTFGAPLRLSGLEDHRHRPPRRTTGRTGR